jgi:hypothetical protein
MNALFSISVAAQRYRLAMTSSPDPMALGFQKTCLRQAKPQT